MNPSPQDLRPCIAVKSNGTKPSFKAILMGTNISQVSYVLVDSSIKEEEGEEKRRRRRGRRRRKGKGKEKEEEDVKEKRERRRRRRRERKNQIHRA
jgi:hypothetical protein